VRIGLGAVRNVGEAAVAALLTARDAGGPFRDLFDVAARVPQGSLNRRVLESLVGAGACDGLGAPRERMLAGSAMALDHAAAMHRERESGQESLFGGGPAAPHTVVAPVLPEVAAWTSREKGAKEKEALGFYLTEHPLEHLRAEVERIATCGIAHVLERGDGAEVRVVGLVSERKQLTTRTGKLMGRVVLEDLTGRVECTLFSEAYEQARPHLENDTLVIADGRVEVREERGAQLLLTAVRPWEQARQQFRPALHLELRATDLGESLFLALDEVLARFPGESEVFLSIVKPDHAREVLRSRRYRVEPEAALLAALKERVPACRAKLGRGQS
jgi:DNA polymerase-3 subunit alpha